MSAIFLDEKVGEHICCVCRKRKAKRRLTHTFDDWNISYMCDLCFDDIRTLMLNTFWIGTRKTRAELEKENPIIVVKKKHDKTN